MENIGSMIIISNFPFPTKSYRASVFKHLANGDQQVKEVWSVGCVRPNPNIKQMESSHNVLHYESKLRFWKYVLWIHRLDERW